MVPNSVSKHELLCRRPIGLDPDFGAGRKEVSLTFALACAFIVAPEPELRSSLPLRLRFDTALGSLTASEPLCCLAGGTAPSLFFRFFLFTFALEAAQTTLASWAFGFYHFVFEFFKGTAVQTALASWAVGFYHFVVEFFVGTADQTALASLAVLTGGADQIALALWLGAGDLWAGLAAPTFGSA